MKRIVILACVFVSACGSEEKAQEASVDEQATVAPNPQVEQPVMLSEAQKRANQATWPQHAIDFMALDCEKKATSIETQYRLPMCVCLIIEMARHSPYASCQTIENATKCANKITYLESDCVEFAHQNPQY